MAEMKSYMVEMSMEVLTEDGEKVRAIRLHGVKNEPIPVPLWCDILERIGRMTPGEEVMLVSGGERKRLVEKGFGYVITDYCGDFIPGDVFRGVDDYELEHCRSGEIVRVNRKTMELFRCLGEFDPRWAEPVSQESMDMIEEIKRRLKKWE